MANVNCSTQAKRDDAVIRRALSILERRAVRHGWDCGSSASAKTYLALRLSHKPHEIFTIILLDAQSRVIAIEELFRGTLTQTAVFPREVVKLALQHNAARVMFAHNHPSGVSKPSDADKLLTIVLANALKLVDVQVLDHFIVGSEDVLSFAEQNLAPFGGREAYHNGKRRSQTGKIR